MMSDKEILEGNKIIAEFMNLKDDKDNYVFPDIGLPESVGAGWYVEVEDMRYHESWDWLIPVVEKIQDLNYPVKIGGCGTRRTKNICTIGPKDIYEDPMINESSNSKIESVWEACTSFIKWYNEMLRT